jgi:hypothetical protein
MGCGMELSDDSPFTLTVACHCTLATKPHLVVAAAAAAVAVAVVVGHSYRIPTRAARLGTLT